MAEQEGIFWNLDSNWLTKPASKVLEEVLQADMANFNRSTNEFKPELALIDKGMALYIELLQVVGKNQDSSLKQSDTLRAATAMAGSLLNYLLLIRHCILLGYFPEARSLERDCHERLTRCLLFQCDEQQAKRFLEGKKIKQENVDKKLASYLAQDQVTADAGSLHQGLRDLYERQSQIVHPNVKSLDMRLFPPAKSEEELASRCGEPPTIGGFLSRDLGRALCVRLLQLLLTSLGTLPSFIREGTGAWKADFEQLRQSYDNLVQQLKDQYRLEKPNTQTP